MGESKHRLLTFADLITLLLVVLVVLYFMPEADKSKYRQVALELVGAFGRREAAVSTGTGVVRQPEEPPAATQSGPAQHAEQPLLTRFNGDSRFTVRTTDRGLVISMAGTAAFDSGRAEITQGLVPLLEAVAERLAGISNGIILEGFSDNVPIRNAEFGSNQDLSEARALQVRAFLEQQGISRERITVVGHGDRNPAWPNDTPEGRARNRRVDVVVLWDAGIQPGQEFSSRPE